MDNTNQEKHIGSNIPSVVIFDIDGVMTTGQFLYSKEGKEYKVFGAHDNDGIKLLDGKLDIVFVTADKRGYPISKKRIVDDMGRDLVIIEASKRFDYIDKVYGLENVIYMGDGYHDASILASCCCGIAPQNARIEAREASAFVTPSKSGEGAVLDASLYILKRYFQTRNLNWSNGSTSK